MRKKPIPINGARSVMAGRKERDNSRDDFWTPPFATRALCEVIFPHLGFPVKPLHFGRTAWEPACGEGHMAEVLKEYFSLVHASDIHAYGYGLPGLNFLTSERGFYDWIITNPPFRGSAKRNGPRQDRALEFTIRAVDRARIGVAMFVRTQWADEGVERYERLFKPHPPTLQARFVERVPLCKGKWDPDGSTATAYCWLVWVKGREPMPPFWIPPGQRKALTRPDDRERFAAWSMPKAMEAAE